MSEEDEDEYTSDVHSVIPTEFQTVEFRSGFIRGKIHSEDIDEGDLEIAVFRDGSHLALNAGTTGDEGDQAYLYQALTVEQAREIADALNEAADRAEECKNQPGARETDSESFIQRLIS